LKHLHNSEFKKYLEKTGKGSKSSEEDMVMDNEAQPEFKQLHFYKIAPGTCLFFVFQISHNAAINLSG